jgi:hypothetical protein
MNDIEIRDVWPCSFVAPIKITSPNDDAIALTEVGGLRGVPWIGLADEDDEAGSRCCLHFDFEAIVDPCAAPSAVGAVQRILHDAPVPLTSPVTLRPPTGSMPAREDSAYLPVHDGRALGSDRGHRCHPRIRACSPSRQLRSRHHAPAGATTWTSPNRAIAQLHRCHRVLVVVFGALQSSSWSDATARTYGVFVSLLALRAELRSRGR